MKIFIDTANINEIREAAGMGVVDDADICTMPFKVLDQLIKHPLTDIGIQKFLSDWKKTQGM